MPAEEGCLFCNIQREEDDARVGILKRGTHWFVILNTFPYINGHIMIVANRHIDSIREIVEEEGRELIELLSRSEEAIERAYQPGGLNIGVNRGASAGAGVEGHLHFHMCPRWKGDTNFITAIGETRVISEDLDQSYQKLLPYFRD